MPRSETNFRWGALGLAAGLVFAVFATAFAGIELTRESGRIASLWLANGVVLVALLRTRPKRWAGWLLCGLAGNLLANRIAGDPSWEATVLSLCNSVEVLVIAGLYQWREPGNQPDLTRFKALFTFFLVGGLVGPGVSAALAASILHLHAGMPFWLVFRTWMAADALGLMLIVPLVTALPQGGLAGALKAAMDPEGMAAAALLGGLTFFLVWGHHFPWIFLLSPFLLLATLRFGFLGVSLGFFMTAASGLAALALGSRAGQTPALRHDIAFFQVFLFANILIFLPIAGLLRALRASETLFRVLFEKAPMGFAVMDSTSGRFLSVNAGMSSFMEGRPEELLQRRFQDFTHPDRLAKDLRTVAALVSGEFDEVAKDKPYIMPSGRVKWGRLRMVRLPDTPGAPARHFSLIEDITERREAERALKASATQTQALLRAIPDLIFLNSRDGTYLDFHAFDPNLLLVPPEAFLGRRVSAVLPQPVAARYFEAFSQALDTNAIQEFQYELELAGETRWFEARVVSCGEDQVMTIARDVTARRKAETTLNLEKERYRGLFEHMHSGFLLLEVILDGKGQPVDHRLLEANAEFEAQTGLKREEEIGRTSAELSFQWPPDTTHAMYRVAMGGPPIHYERFNESLQRHYDIRAFSPGRGQLGMLFNDITRRKAVEQALVESQEKFAKIFNSGPILSALTDLATGRLVEVNERYCQVLGYAREELLGRTTLELGLLQPEDRVRLTEPLTYGGGVHSVEFTMQAKDGRAIPCLFSGEILEVGRQTLLISMVSDITDVKQAERERALLRNEVEHMQKLESLGRLAGGVAHDMNNVLGAILALASAQLAILPPDHPTCGTFATIRDASTRGADMVKRLLAFARQNPVQQRELDLNALLMEDVRLLERTTLAKVQLDLDLAADLRPVLGDASALAHAIMNLCVNAVDAMDGRGTLAFRTRNLGEDQVEILLSDTGCGMSQDVLARAMDPFFTTKEVGKGTGLGLSMAYTTVKAHGGQLQLESRPGQGTEVRITFPALQVPGPEAQVQARPVALTPTLDVLLVDDDDLILKSTRMLLEVLGHRVTAAPSGEEALALVAQGARPDLVVLDMNMPGLGGKGTLPKLRALQPQVPVLLATGRTDQEALDLVEGDPLVTLLPKPFSLQELQAGLAAVSGTAPRR